jgi:hypothetical protein
MSEHELYGVNIGHRRVSYRFNGTVLIGHGDGIGMQYTIATSRAGVLALIEALQEIAGYMAEHSPETKP